MPFTMDNTEGYSASELAELNRRFTARVAALGENEPEKSKLDHIAERLLVEFDQEQAEAADGARQEAPCRPGRQRERNDAPNAHA